MDFTNLKIFMEHMSDEYTPGNVVEVFYGGKSVYRYASGFADILDTINRRLEIGFILKPNEVLYIEVQKKAARAYLGNENDKATSHLNSLLMLAKKV